MKKLITKTLLLGILSSLYLDSNSKVFSQDYTIYTTDNIIYPISIEQSDIIIEKNESGYYIYVRKKGQVNGVNLLIEGSNGDRLKIYKNDIAYDENSNIKLTTTMTHPILGESFYTSLPDYVDTYRLNNRNTVRIVDNMPIIAQTFISDNNGNIIASLDNNIILLVEESAITNPYLKLESVSKHGNTYSFILSYSGGRDRKYAFYVREGITSREYKIIDTLWGYERTDNQATVLNDTYKDKLGKVLQIEAFFEELPHERYLAFNVFDENGRTRTMPVDYIIPASITPVETTPPPLPEIDETRPAEIRSITESDETIEDNENSEDGAIITVAETLSTEEPIVIIDEPTLEEEPVIIDEPTLEEEPVIIDEPTLEEEPVIIDEPTLEEEPVIIDEPTLEEIIEIESPPKRVIPTAAKNYEFDTNTVIGFYEIEDAFEKSLNYVNDPSNLPKKISDALLQHKTESIDIVIVIDSTQSMEDSLRAIKAYINTLSRDLFSKYKKVRIGFVLFRDIGDNYITKKIDFMEDPSTIYREVKYFYATGGGDQPEPIYEAIDVALKEFGYNAQTNKILIITDAAPKVIGDANVNSTSKLAKSLGVELETLLLPKSKNKSYLY